MLHDCSFHAHVNRVDPTRTTMLRRLYERDMRRRFRQIRRAIIELIVLDDVFGLQTETANASLLTQVRLPAGFKTHATKPGKRAFAFTRSDQKVSSFMDWLRRAESADILEVSPGTPMQAAAQSAWQNVYLRSAYQKGLANAGAQLKKQGVEVEDSWLQQAFFRPVHADRAGLIFTRAYGQLEGITDTMDGQISRALAEGIVEGLGARQLAKKVAERVDVGLTRARVLARTEVIAANAQASLNAYKEAGIEGVKVLSEFSTAEDNKVCPKCQSLDDRYGANGKPLKVSDAEGIIPVHPNCRCAWVPVVIDPEGKALR